MRLGIAGRRASVDDFRLAARRRLPRMIADFVDGGADGEQTVEANVAGFSRLSFRPRQLVDVGERAMTCRVLGTDLTLPVLLAPAGLARLVHPEGELAAARAAARAGTIFVLSTASSYSIEEVAAVSSGPKWFQLYLWRDREVVAGLLDRAAAAGYDAVCLTVDVPIVGNRLRDVRNGMTIPPRVSAAAALDVARHPRWWWGLLRGPPITFRNFLGMADGDSAVALGSFVNRQMIDPTAAWADAEWLRSRWEGPLIVKGVLTAEDARRAVDTGADAVVVSNHGGRQLDSAPATIDMLPEVVAEIGGDAEVLLDGGVRRGGDVVKAVALGAGAVMVGRPWFWALAADGEDGILAMLEMLAEEIDRTLALLGRPNLSDLDAATVERR